MPFEPNVEKIELPADAGKTKEAYLLRSDRFKDCTSADEVREVAIPLLRHLNGLLVVRNPKRLQSVVFNSVVEHADDGSIIGRTQFGTGTARGSARVRGVATGGTAAPPRPSFAQGALSTADRDQLDGLEFLSRGDNWHDLYKAYEALGARDKEQTFSDLGFDKKDIENFRLSAQLERHHNFSGKPPSKSLTIREGRAFLADAFRRLFSERL